MTWQPTARRASHTGEAGAAHSADHLAPQQAAEQTRTWHASADPDDLGAATDVAAAMLAYVMAGHPAQVRLEIECIRHRVLLHIIYPAASNRVAPHHLTAIDSLAERWGTRGNCEWHVLWAIVPATAGPATPDAGRSRCEKRYGPHPPETECQPVCALREPTWV